MINARSVRAPRREARIALDKSALRQRRSLAQSAIFAEESCA
jgi:hypothetical protein